MYINVINTGNKTGVFEERGETKLREASKILEILRGVKQNQEKCWN